MVHIYMTSLGNCRTCTAEHRAKGGQVLKRHFNQAGSGKLKKQSHNYVQQSLTYSQGNDANVRSTHKGRWEEGKMYLCSQTLEYSEKQMASIRVHSQHHGNDDGTELAKVKQSPIIMVPCNHIGTNSGSELNNLGLKSSLWHFPIVYLE